MSDNPVADMTKDEALEWFRTPPSRAETYRNLVALNAIAGHLVNASASIMNDDRKDAIEHLQEALDGLKANLTRLPQLDEEILRQIEDGVG